jgi:hypothetical protein
MRFASPTEPRRPPSRSGQGSLMWTHASYSLLTLSVPRPRHSAWPGAPRCALALAGTPLRPPACLPRTCVSAGITAALRRCTRTPALSKRPGPTSHSHSRAWGEAITIGPGCNTPDAGRHLQRLRAGRGPADRDGRDDPHKVLPERMRRGRVGQSRLRAASARFLAVVSVPVARRADRHLATRWIAGLSKDRQLGAAPLTSSTLPPIA